MKKLNALLHDVTVINFTVVGKLVLRYRKLTWLALIMVLVLVPYFFYSQIVIKQKQVFFKIQTQTKEANSTLSTLVEGATLMLNRPEILALVNTYAFTTLLAENIVDSEAFSQMDFNSPLVKSGPAQSELLKCQDRDCRIAVVRSLAPSFYVLDSDFDTDRFSLTITSRSDTTTLEILRSFQVALRQARLVETSENMDKQISQLQDLIEKSRTDIEAKGGFSQLVASESLEALIVQQNGKISSILGRLNLESDQHSFQRIRLKESELTANRDIQGTEKLTYENFTKLNRQVEELRQNIAFLNSTPPNSRSQTDEQVLVKLKEELRIKEKELLRIGDSKRNVAFEDTFINKQINNRSEFAFDYKVTSAKKKMLQSEYEEAKTELNKLFSQKARMDNDLFALKPDLEYLRQMESRLVSMKMMKAAITSDVYFDNYGPDVRSYKRNSFVQIFLFSFLLVSFLLFITVIAFYMCDDRIYDEFEIEKCCDDLPIIGHAPHFE